MHKMDLEIGRPEQMQQRLIGERTHKPPSTRWDADESGDAAVPVDTVDRVEEMK